MKKSERMARMREARPVAELVDRVLSGYRVAEDVRRRRILTRWSKIVGDRIAGNTAPGRIQDGVLEVRVRTSSWMQELSFIADDLVARINQMAGDPPLVREVRFNLGRPRYPKPQPPPAREGYAGVRVTARPASVERRAQIERESSDVEDHELRALICSVRQRYDL